MIGKLRSDDDPRRLRRTFKLIEVLGCVINFEIMITSAENVTGNNLERCSRSKTLASILCPPRPDPALLVHFTETWTKKSVIEPYTTMKLYAGITNFSEC